MNQENNMFYIGHEIKIYNNCLILNLKHLHIFTFKAMCIHLGMTEAFIWDKDTADERRTGADETKTLLEEIRNEIEKDGRRLIYPHEVCKLLGYLFNNFETKRK
jgi:hypothetical protein